MKFKSSGLGFFSSLHFASSPHLCFRHINFIPVILVFQNMLWKQLLFTTAFLASSAVAAPQFKNSAGKNVPSSQALTCNDGVCCDQFGGCILQNDLGDFADRVVNRRSPSAQFRNSEGENVPSSQALSCNDGVCCDESGGCVFEKDLGDLSDRVVN
ncbi:unnamed protein product [Periconia digitata]|uniref:Uncharacterized protein n=1 Tax=Periconia digitata TaxID=1303443 RepID=A0A9W4UV77_9PLEO|nr:unnamed protein product [Periconia digitata]